MFLVPLSSGLVLNPSPLLRAGGYDVRPCALVMGVGGDEATRDPEDDASMFQEYLKSRGSAELEQVEEGYRSVSTCFTRRVWSLLTATWTLIAESSFLTS